MFESFETKDRSEYDVVLDQLASFLKNFGEKESRGDVARSYISSLGEVPVCNWITHTVQTYGSAVIPHVRPYLFKLANARGEADLLEAEGNH